MKKSRRASNSTGKQGSSNINQLADFETSLTDLPPKPFNTLLLAASCCCCFHSSGFPFSILSWQLFFTTFPTFVSFFSRFQHGLSRYTFQPLQNTTYPLFSKFRPIFPFLVLFFTFFLLFHSRYGHVFPTVFFYYITTPKFKCSQILTFCASWKLLFSHNFHSFTLNWKTTWILSRCVVTSSMRSTGKSSRLMYRYRVRSLSKISLGIISSS